MNKKIAIVGIFWDGYYDIWEDFLELKERFWSDCSYPFYIVNQVCELKYEKNYGVNVIHAGIDAEYSKKVQAAIDHVDADYILLLLEDFFFTKKLDGNILDYYIDLMVKENLKYIRMPLNEFVGSFKGERFKNYNSILNIGTSSEYTLSCQPSLWESGFLKKCIGNGNYNAWVFEGIYAQSKMAHSLEFLTHCKIDTSNTLGLVHGALQGKMIPQTIDKIREVGYEMKNKRPIMSQIDYKKHERKERIKALIPYSLQKIIKGVTKKNSVIEKYGDEIRRQMVAMGIE